MRPSQLLLWLLSSIGVIAAPLIPYDNDPPKRQTGCTSPSIRPEWRNMPDDQKQAYVQAVLCLFQRPALSGLPGASNRMEDLAAVHQAMTQTIHRDGLFLPWHRYMLFAHETLLRYECGYTGPMPWWDETLDAGRFQYAPMFTSQYFGSAPPMPPQCITDGMFAGMMLTIGPGLGQISHCLNRGVDERLSRPITTGYINQCNGFSDYSAMYRCVFDGPHGYGHDAVGGVMADVDSSPGDPIFYLHHAMIDRNWRNWQLADPAGRMYAIDGPTTERCTSNCTEATLDTPLQIWNIVADARVQDVMDTEGGYLCYQYDY